MNYILVKLISSWNIIVIYSFIKRDIMHEIMI